MLAGSISSHSCCCCHSISWTEFSYASLFGEFTQHAPDVDRLCWIHETKANKAEQEQIKTKTTTGGLLARWQQTGESGSATPRAGPGQLPAGEEGKKISEIWLVVGWKKVCCGLVPSDLLCGGPKTEKLTQTCEYVHGGTTVIVPLLPDTVHILTHSSVRTQLVYVQHHTRDNEWMG